MIAIDLECSGNDASKHSMVSIGAVDIDNPSNQFYAECRMWDGAAWLQEALDVNGFTLEEITDPSKPSAEEVIVEFMEWVKTVKGAKILVAENVAFDHSFILAAAARAGLPKPFGHRCIDVHSLSVMHHLTHGKEIPLQENKMSALNLDGTLNYVGIPGEPQPHNALTGAKTHAEVFARLIWGKNILDEFKQFPLPSHLGP